MANAIATHPGEFAGGREGARLEFGGLVTEATGGAAAIVLAILGLLHIAPVALVSIATIVVGASFLLLGGVLAARLVHRAADIASPAARAVIAEGTTMACLCGAAGIVLGILAFVSADAATLVPVAAIVFGGGLLMAGSTAARLDHEPLVATPGPGVLLAVAGVVLGILALAGHAPIALSLVAMLGFGVGVLLGSTAFAGMLTAVLAE